MYLDYYTSLKIIQSRLNSSKFKLRFHNKPHMFYTDLKNKEIYVPEPNPEMEEQEFLRWYHGLLHEINHHDLDPTGVMSSYLIDNKINTKSKNGLLLNLLEDFRIENPNNQKYIGVNKVISEDTKYWIDLFLSTSEYPKDVKELLGWYYKGKIDNDINLYGYKDKIVSDKHDEYLEELKSLSNPNDTIRLYEKMKSKDEKDDEDLEKEVQKILQETMEDYHPEDEEEVKTLKPKPIEQNDELEALVPVIKDLDNCQLKQRYYGIEEKTVPIASAFRRYTKPSFRYEQKEGEFDYDDVWKAKTPSRNRIYTQEYKTIAYEKNIMLVLDYSASMRGLPLQTALNCQFALYKALKNLPKVHLAMFGFTTTGGCWTKNLLLPIKEFNEHPTVNVVKDRLLKSTNKLANNNDGDILHYLYETRLRHRQGSKTMIVISDGDPAGRAGIREYTQEVVKVLEKLINLWSIYIMSESDIYTNTISISNPNKLETELLNLCNLSLLR